MKWESIEKPYHLQGGVHFSYIAANFHPEVRIYWKTVPLAGRHSLFLHCSNLPSWSENLLKNHTTCRVAVIFRTLQQTSILKWESIEKPYHLQGSSHFSYITVIFREHVKENKFKSKFSISMYTCKKERHPWLWMGDTEVCHKLTTLKIGK